MTGNSEKTAKASKKPRGKPFAPGQSGNPSGRPKTTPEQQDALAAIRALAPNAAEVLSNIMSDEKAAPAARLKAAEIVLERTYGKAEAPVRVEDTRETTLGSIRAEVEKIKAAVAGE